MRGLEEENARLREQVEQLEQEAADSGDVRYRPLEALEELLRDARETPAAPVDGALLRE